MTRIGIIAELHMRTNYAEKLERELEWIANHFEERFRPDHVFVLGDIIQHGTTPEEDERNVRRVTRILDDRPYPTTYLLGNHDAINLSRAELSEILDQESFFGEVVVDGRSFVYLDSSLGTDETASGMVGSEQLSFLEDALSQDGDSIVLVHHPIGDFDLSDNYWFADYPEQAYLCDRKRVLEIAAREGNVLSTISGHVHSDGCTEFGGVPHLSIGAFSKESPDVPISGTYAELTVDGSVTAEIKVRNETVSRYEVSTAG